MNKNYVLSILIGCLCFLSGTLIGQIIVTPASGGSSICVGSSTSTSLGTLTLTETANGDMANGAQSYTLNTPPNFTFDNTATITFGNTLQLTGITSSFPTSTTLKIDFTVASTAGQIDHLDINGIKVFAITAPAFGNITSGTNTLAVGNTVNNGTLFSISTPDVSITNANGGVTCTSPVTDNTTFNAYGATSYQFFVDGVSVQGPSASSVLNYHWATTVGSPHAVTVKGTSGSACVGQSSASSMAVNLAPSINWSPSNQSFALGDADDYLNLNGTITPSPTGGTSVFSGSGVSFNGTYYLFSPSAAGNGSHTITLDYTVGGCTATTNKTFTVSTANSISGLNSSYCTYNTGNSLSITPPSGKTVSQYQYYNWISSAYSNIPNPEYVGGNSCTFSPVKFATYSGGLYYTSYGYAYVRVLYTDGTVSPLATTYVYDKPYVALTVPNTELCNNGSNVTLSIYPPDNGVSYTQATGTGVSETSPGSGVWQVNPSGALGNRTITYFYETTYSPQCQNSISITVHINPPPTANINTATLDPVGYCKNSSSSFPLSGTPVGGTFSGPGTYANYFYPYYQTSIGPNTITYTYTDANGCSDAKTHNITIFNDPSVSIRMINSDTSVCLPLSGNGTYTFEGKYQGCATGVTWQAYDGSVFTSVGNSGNFSFASPNTGYNTATSFTNSTYQINQGYAYLNAVTTGQPASCPAANDYAYAFLIPKPNVIITNLPKDKYCTAEPNISLSGKALYKYPDYFNFPLSNGIGDVTNISSLPLPPAPGDPALVGTVFQPSSATPGNHDIRYTFTDPTSGCSNYNDTTIIINQNPVANFIVDSGRCATKYTYFDAVPSTIPPSTTVTYTWDFGDGTSLADTSHLQKPKYTYPFPGGYPVSLTLLTNQGCSDTKALTGANLLTIQSIPISDFDFRFQCLNDNTLFDTLSTIQAGAKKNRTWIFADNNGTPLFTQTQTSSVATMYVFPKPANYQVTMIDSTTLGCTDRKKKGVFILPYITPTITSPYGISFKDSSGNWGQNGANSTWVHDIPNAVSKPLMHYGGAGVIDSAWVTSITGKYNAGEKSSIHSPCINFSQLDKPMISIRLWTATQEQIAGAVLNTSTDGGITWNTIGKVGDGIDWYNSIGIAGSPGTLTTNDGWSGVDTSWRQARIGLPIYANYNPAQKVRFKITFGAPNDPTIARSEGIAVDSVWIGNKNKVVLMEHFTNNASDGSTTPAITAANNSMNSVRDTRKKDLAAIYYHTSFPAVDLFNAYYPAGPSSRVLYYGVTSSPRTVLDGTYYNGNIYSGSTPDARIDVADVDARSLQTAIFNLDMTSTFSPGVATVATKVTYNAIAAFSNDLVLHTVITEDDSSGAVKYASIARQMLPDAAGNYISRTWHKGDNISVGQTWNHTLPSTAVLGVVTFIQNASTKEIYQAAYLRGPGNYGSAVATGVVDETEEFKVRMFPNPATDEVFFLYGKALRTASDWEVYDNIGRKVESGTCSVGKEGFSINTSNYTGGIYYIKLKGEKGSVDHKELVVIH